MNEDKATRYHRLKRQASVASLVWGVALLGGLLWSGASLTLRDAAESIGAHAGPASGPILTTAIYVVLLCALNEVGDFADRVLQRLPPRAPLRPVERALRRMAARSGEVVRHRPGLRVRRRRDRLRAHSRVARGWWLPAGAVFALLIVGLANLAPVAAAAALLPPSSRSIASRCARGCSRSPNAPARACSARTNGGWATRPRRPTRR